MKIRTGFVSNSSTSSFLIGICRLTEEQVQQLTARGVDLEHYLFKVGDPALSEYSRRDGLFTVVSFMGSSVDVYANEGDYILVLDVRGDEPEEDEDGYYDDEPTDDLFLEHHLMVSSIISEFGGDTHAGVGRDG